MLFDDFMFNERPIIYEDSMVPELVMDIQEKKPRGIAFYIGGKRYFLSNDGNSVFSQGGHKSEELGKQEFRVLTAHMLFLVKKYFKDDKRKQYEEYISSLDFSKGHKNSFFEVHNMEWNPIACGKPFVAVNYVNYRYIYELEDDKVLRINRQSRNGTMRIVDEESEKIKDLVNNSKTVKKMMLEPQKRR